LLYLCGLMKTLLFIFALVTSLAADEFRTWTQAGSEKKIEAKILDKNEGKVQLSTKDGKSYWMDVAKLIQEDQDFISAWKKKPLGFEPLTVDVTGKPITGQKSISVVAKAWEKGLTVVVYFEKGGNRIMFNEQIEPYGFRSWSGNVGNNYLVTLEDADGNVILQQAATSKN
jgi:SLA1 homology domain 1, SHD1